MAGHAPFTQAEIDALVAKLQTYKYVVSVGSDVLGPLKSAPKFEPDVETKEIKLYETGAEPMGEVVTKNNGKLTVELEDMDKAMELSVALKKGDNIFDSAKRKVITLQPITSDTNAKTITFPNAYIRPGFKPNFEDEDNPNYATLEYTCKPYVGGSGGAVVSGAVVGLPFFYDGIVTSGGTVTNGAEE